jgi:hypothetical protein
MTGLVNHLVKDELLCWRSLSLSAFSVSGIGRLIACQATLVWQFSRPRSGLFRSDDLAV